jgi:hypothetical protein
VESHHRIGQSGSAALRGKSRLWVTIIIAVFGVFAISSVLLLEAFKTREQRTNAQVQRHLDAIRTSGQPMTANDLARLFPDPPPERDVSRILQSAIAQLSIPEEPTNIPLFGTVDLPRSGELHNEMKADIERLLDRNRLALGSIPWDRLYGTWVGSGFANGFTNLTVTKLAPIIQLTKLLCLEGVLQAETQSSTEAMQRLRCALAIGATLKDDLPIHHWAKCTVQAFVCQTLERVLNRTRVSAAELASLAPELTVTNMAALKDIMIHERCLGLYFAGYYKATAAQIRATPSSPIGKLLRIYQSRLLYHEDDFLQYLNWSQQCLEALDLPFTNAFALLRTIEEKDKVNRFSFLDAFRSKRPSMLILNEPQINQFLLREAKAVTRVRLAITGLAIEHYRLEHSQDLPNALVDLVPVYLSAVPTDPFNDLPLQYKRLAKGYVIYSVGDFVGSSGNAHTADENGSRPANMTFTVER